ncbi:MAG: Two component transcriptional regulator, winged helix family [Thermotoga sp. 50_1627]|uniref:response regulator transcription factor n=1 Tax=Pseudothermotoga sp. TaxID=2033661 RepID=UPI00076D84A2|nr:MAG: Two component transcriptional regulator, winged helix family [Thermotoga sp. 50_64]KUK25970.1 MAG: Two component transcriptional regulator, winged helix family [Thermotoga sp. 50_1627]MBC7116047.1 response regulator transcription factor [Pseudothermotoga sp.]MDK2922659.1 two-component system, OmpR family, response regulator ArlR [Pseudothermotoga sp.]HBT38633.1 DNA-binding response regulator [Pseudothermotoga sp.]
MEDDQKIARLLQILFESHGYEVRIARDGEEGWELFHLFDPVVVVLDLMLPGMDGFEVLEKIRSVDEEVGVVVLTARGEVENKIRGLKKGADDYVPKPFHLDELLARVESVARRVRKKDVFHVGDVTFVPKMRKLVFPDGSEVNLSDRESAILELFCEKRGNVVSREELLEKVWGDTDNISRNVVDVYVKYLRDKLGKSAKFLKTVRGAGYVLDT